MEILFIADPLSSHTQKWLRCLTEDNHQIYLISYHNKSKITIQNVTEIAHFKPVNKNPFTFIKHLSKIKRIITELKPDVLTCHYALGSTGLLASLANFHPLIIAVLGGPDLYGNKLNKLRFILYNKLLLKFIFGKANLIVVGCQDNKRYLINKDIPEEKIVVIPGPGGLGVDLSMFNDRYDTKNLKEEMGLKDKFVIFCPRRIVPYTNIGLLIKSMPVIKKTIPNATLMLLTYAAKKRYLAYIKQLVKKYGIESDVIFIAEKNNKRMPILYCASDCVISISSFDGIPSTIGESMACKIPVITYGLDSIREYVKNEKNGIIINKLNTAEIIKAALEIYNNKEMVERIKQSGFIFVKEHLDIEKGKNSLKALYQELYERKNRN